jgi:hypothetical protein
MFSAFHTTALAAIAAGAMVVCSPRAAKASEYDFSFTASGGPVGDASGVFDVTGNLITGISGTTNFGTITGLTSYLGNDNGFSPTSPWLTFNGVSFTTSDGRKVNLFTEPLVGGWGLEAVGVG